MGPIQDQVSLPLLRLQEMPFMPAFLQTDEQWSTALVPSSTKSASALPAENDYPLHTPAAVWLSAAYAAGAPLYDIPVPDSVMPAIKQAAVLFGIEKEVEEVILFQQAGVKSANTSDVFALTVEGTGYYPLGTRFAVMRAAEGVANDFEAGRLPLSRAREAAGAVMKRASVLKLVPELLPARITTLGRDTIMDVDLIHKMAAARDRTTGTDLYSFSLKDVDPQQNADFLYDTWRMLDTELGVRKSASTPDPADVFCYGIDREEFEKIARNTMIVEGQQIGTEVFTLVPMEAYESWYREPTKRASVQDLLAKAATSGVDASVALDLMDPELRADLLSNVQAYHARQVQS